VCQQRIGGFPPPRMAGELQGEVVDFFGFFQIPLDTSFFNY
jgi:hypothetical protein